MDEEKLNKSGNGNLQQPSQLPANLLSVINWVNSEAQKDYMVDWCDAKADVKQLYGSVGMLLKMGSEWRKDADEKVFYVSSGNYSLREVIRKDDSISGFGNTIDEKTKLADDIKYAMQPTLGAGSTAFHVAEGIIATAGHTFWKDTGLIDIHVGEPWIWINDLAWSDEEVHSNKFPDTTRISAANVFFVKSLLRGGEATAYNPERPNSADFALLSIEPALEKGKFPPTLPLARRMPMLYEGLLNIAHPLGMRLKVNDPPTTSFSGIAMGRRDPFNFKHNLDIYSVCSGSPVLRRRRDNRELEVVGINASGEDVFELDTNTNLIRRKVPNPLWNYNIATAVDRIRWIIDPNAAITTYIQFWDQESYNPDDVNYAEPTDFKIPPVTVCVYNTDSKMIPLGTILDEPSADQTTSDDEPSSSSPPPETKAGIADALYAVHWVTATSLPKSLKIAQVRSVDLLPEKLNMEKKYWPRLRSLKMRVHEPGYPGRGVTILDEEWDLKNSKGLLIPGKAKKFGIPMALPPSAYAEY